MILLFSIIYRAFRGTSGVLDDFAAEEVDSSADFCVENLINFSGDFDISPDVCVFRFVNASNPNSDSEGSQFEYDGEIHVQGSLPVAPEEGEH